MTENLETKYQIHSKLGSPIGEKLHRLLVMGHNHMGKGVYKLLRYYDVMSIQHKMKWQLVHFFKAQQTGNPQGTPYKIWFTL